jgi:hypothetical protein
LITSFDPGGAQEWLANLSPLTIATLLACFVGATIAIVLTLQGVAGSLRSVHQLSPARTFAAFALGLILYTVFLVVVALPFDKVLHA